MANVIQQNELISPMLCIENYTPVNDWILQTGLHWNENNFNAGILKLHKHKIHAICVYLLHQN